MTPREQWIAALRSGEYKQGKQYLCYQGRYCCLGVAADLYLREKGIASTHCNMLVVDGHSCGLPDTVREWLGLRSGLGHSVRNMFRALYKLNDIENLTFEQIADILEKDDGEYFFPETTMDSGSSEREV